MYLPPPQAPLVRPRWHGPDAGRSSSTEYFQQEVRGRSGANHRKSNDILIRQEGSVARLIPDPAHRHRVTSAGMLVTYEGVRSCTSRGFRRRLDSLDPPEVHLCRGDICKTREAQGQGDGRLHIREYAAVASDAAVDFGLYAKFSPWRVGVLLWRGWRGGLYAGLWALYWASRVLCCCCRARSSKKGSKPAAADPVAALLDLSLIHI